MAPTPHHLLASSIASDGIDAHAAAIAALVAAVRRDERSSLVLDILADVAQPAVARERAFGRLLRDLASPAAPHAASVHATAA